MYKSKLKKYKKILLIILLLYYICLPYLCKFEEKQAQIIFLFGCGAILILIYVNLSTVIKQDKFIEEHYRDIYDSFRNDWRRPLNISFILLINREKDPRMKKLLEETKDLIKLNLTVFAAMFASLILTVFTAAFISL